MRIKSSEKLVLLLAAFFLFGSAFEAKAQPDPTFLKIIKGEHKGFTCNLSDDLEKLVLNGYGAVFVSEGAILPENCLFKSEAEITAFQCKIKGMQGSKLENIDYYLQPNAAKALEKVFAKMVGYKNVARNFNGTTVTRPNGLSDDWAMRTLRQTECNWIGAGANANKCDDAILSNSFTKSKILEAVPDDGYKHMFSYAIPGGSQHHFGLAIDVNNGSVIKPSPVNKIPLCDEENCVKALNENGWYRTVPTDEYHFTYLGYKDPAKLEAHGLKLRKCGKFNYWVPVLPPEYENAYIKGACN